MNSEMTHVNPAPVWLTDKSWIELLNLGQLPLFKVSTTPCINLRNTER